MTATFAAWIIYTGIVGLDLVEGERPKYLNIIISNFNTLGLTWFDVLMFGSFIKVGSSCVKYMPQVYLNWKRKCTLGFAIDKGTVLFVVYYG